ncbi:MAG TPA: OmpA family protein [Desulfuromonadaceae bacterium]
MNSRAACRCLVLVVLAVALAGCSAPRSQFVLLPSPDGHVGTVTVASKSGEARLGTAFESTSLARPEEQPVPPVVLTEETVNTLFRDALAAQPAPPVTYILYFGHASAALTQASAKLLPQIVEYIRKSGSTDISISGHTDKMGPKEVNNRLSLERAHAVAKLLREMGVAPDSLEVSFHGMMFPLVDTPEGVSEPRNRRVEIVVR